jgi:hypothetical protein
VYPLTPVARSRPANSSSNESVDALPRDDEQPARGSLATGRDSFHGRDSFNSSGSVSPSMSARRAPRDARSSSAKPSRSRSASAASARPEPVTVVADGEVYPLRMTPARTRVPTNTPAATPAVTAAPAPTPMSSPDMQLARTLDAQTRAEAAPVAINWADCIDEPEPAPAPAAALPFTRSFADILKNGR